MEVVTIELRRAEVGSAAAFRSDINYNFNIIEGAINEDKETISDIQEKLDMKPTMTVSAEQPVDMQPGDLWIEP